MKYIFPIRTFLKPFKLAKPFFTDERDISSKDGLKSFKQKLALKSQVISYRNKINFLVHSYKICSCENLITCNHGLLLY